MPVINVQETPFKPSQQLALLRQVVCGTSEMCLLRGAHDNNCDSAEDAKHLRPRFIRVHAVRTIPGWHGTNAPEDKCSCIPNFLYTWFTILTDLFALDKSSKAIFFAPCLKGEYLNWMNERHVELQHNDKCILRKFERRTCMAIYGTLNKQRCLSL